MRNPFGWDLPPGCSHADIDRAMGGSLDICPDCEGEGKILNESNCCGAAIICGDLCAKCKEHCEPTKCETCDGTGEVSVKTKHQREPEDDRED